MKVLRAHATTKSINLLTQLQGASLLAPPTLSTFIFVLSVFVTFSCFAWQDLQISHDNFGL